MKMMTKHQSLSSLLLTTTALLLLFLGLQQQQRQVVDASVAPPREPHLHSNHHSHATAADISTEQLPPGKRLTEETMSQNIRQMEYAVRGKIVIAADLIAEELLQLAKLRSDDEEGEKEGDATAVKTKKYDFDHIVFTNIGNPQSMGQKPLTWPRQVMALVDLPDNVGVDHPLAEQIFPKDALERARTIKQNLACGSTGAYSHSKGVKLFRDDVAYFLKQRDGANVPVTTDDIFLTNGASAGIVMILNALIANEKCGVMIPIPQYPIYSATIDQFGGQTVGYYLDEKNGWDMNLQEMERAIQDARSKGIIVNSFVLINPGNPTGSVLSKKTIKDVIKFCIKHKLVLLADEVYQENIYDDKTKFVSVKKVAYEAGYLSNGNNKQQQQLELVSFHSTSKGVFGECGRRGGYMELVGIDDTVKDHMYKLASAGLCSSLNGQIMTSLMCRGPSPGDESYESHENEKNDIYQSLKRRSKIVSDGLNRIPGVSCQPAQGAMYSFPSVEMPQKAIEAAQEAGISPDTLYALSLLESRGICVVPASGFHQKPGRFGFRTTFLVSEDEMERCVDRIRSHHEEFCSKYA